MSGSPAARTTRGLVAGIDVGGTKVRAALRDRTGQQIAEQTVASDALRADPVTGLHQLIGTLLRLSGTRSTELSAVGVGIPGAVDPSSRRISRCPAFPVLDGVDLRTELTGRLDVPVIVENDANAAAWAEYRLGGHDHDQLACLALGTGIGLGVVADGRLLRGSHGAAGEVAELPVRIDGKRQPVESIASVSGLLRARGWRDPERVKELVSAAGDGDPAALRAITVYAEAVGDAVVAICGLLDPGVVVLTGGLGMRRVIVERVTASLPREQQKLITVSRLGERAPLLGALTLAEEHLDHDQQDHDQVRQVDLQWVR